MSLLVLLGTGLVSLLRNGISIWDTAESRGVAYDRARAILERVADDLRSAVARSGPTAAHSWVRFLCDVGPEGKQRLRFVRTIAGEAADPVFREGGKLLTSRGGEVYDGLGGVPERNAGYLAAPAGLMEVFYTLDPRAGAKRLWRGVRSPIGGPGSLFVDENIEADGKVSRLEEVAVPVSDDVLFIGFRFWTWGTNTWKPAPPLQEPKAGEQSGPALLWDSTRALLESEGGRGEFAWKRRPESLEDPTDDLFPELVEATLVVAEREGMLGTRLAADLSAGGTLIVVSRDLSFSEDESEKYVRVDDEWIAIERVEGNRLHVAKDGRGARWTTPVDHERGSRVEQGVTFRRVVELPAFRAGLREAKPDPRAARRLGR